MQYQAVSLISIALLDQQEIILIIFGSWILQSKQFNHDIGSHSGFSSAYYHKQLFYISHIGKIETVFLQHGQCWKANNSRHFYHTSTLPIKYSTTSRNKIHTLTSNLSSLSNSDHLSHFAVLLIIPNYLTYPYSIYTPKISAIQLSQLINSIFTTHSIQRSLNWDP